MENSNQQTVHAVSRGWLTLLLSVVVAVFAAYFPFALIIAPALWAFAGVRTKPYWMILPVVAFAACMASFDSAIVAAGLSGSAALAAVILYVMMTRRASNTDTALLLSGVFLVGLYTAACLPGIIAGRGAFADIQSAMDSFLAFYKTALAQTPQIDADMAKSALEMMNSISQEVPTGFVAFLCVFSSVFGLGNLLFFRLFCRKHSEISISPIRPFRDWVLPRSMTFGLFVMLIGSLILEMTGWAFAESFSATVNVLVVLPLLLQGLCVVEFFIVRSQKNLVASRTLTYVGIGILFRYAAVALVVLGCFDQIFRLRARLNGTPPQPEGKE